MPAVVWPLTEFKKLEHYRMISPWERRGKGFGFANRPAVPAWLALASLRTTWRPRRPCGSRRLNQVVSFSARIGPHAAVRAPVFPFQHQSGCRRPWIVMGEGDL